MLLHYRFTTGLLDLVLLLFQWSNLTMKKTAVISFFSLYLFCGIALYQDYGISFDEGSNRAIGAVTAQYINKIFGSPLSIDYPLPDLKSYKDRDYGVLIELPLIAAEYLFRISDSQKIYFLRHLLTFLVFWGGTVFFFLLLERIFTDWRIALLGTLFLIISPRIFADSFYNSKDGVFLSVCIPAAYSLIRFLDNKTLPNAAIHALCCAAAISVRIVGIFIPFIALLFVGIEFIKEENKQSAFKQYFFMLLLYGAVLFITTWLLWPYLWENPIGNFIHAFEKMRSYDWHDVVLYRGAFIYSDQLPWHYIPVWIIITTPVVFLVLFAFGIGTIGAFILKNGFRVYHTNTQRSLMVLLMCFLQPLLSVIILHSVLYDGWRHLYFIYPSFIGIAIAGLIRLIHTFKKFSWFFRYAVIMLIATGIAEPVFFMIQYHPFQNVYFSGFAGNHVDENFELDYWGLSFRKALEYVLRSDTSRVVNVCIANIDSTNNIFIKILEKKNRDRIRLVPLEKASYFISNYRMPEEHALFLRKQYPYINLIFSIPVQGNKIVGVYAL
jgi:hypothetical protein